MNTEIREQLATLAALQKTETEMMRIEGGLAGVEKKIASLGASIAEIQEDLERSQAELDSLKKNYRSDENEVKTLESRAVKSDEKLRGVKTNKEYQSILKEMDDLKLKAGEIEDRMLASLEQIETAEASVMEKKKDLGDCRMDIESRQAEIRTAAQEQQARLDELKKRRDAIWEEMTPKLQKLFLKVKQQGRGIAVAGVEGSVCQVCRMNIPPQLYNELLRMDILRFCPNCQRIIYPLAIIG